MRRLLALAALLAVAALVAVGLGRAGDGDGDDADATAPRPLSRAEVTEPLRRAPPELARLHRRMGELVPGGARALDVELRRLRGRPVVVNLWASWCGPCRVELPFFQAQVARRGRSVAFLGVNVEDSREGARSLLDRFPLPYPSILDRRGAVVRRLRVAGLPSTAFYDRRGRLTIVHQGQYRTEGDLADDIERYAS
jgi:thiol-disulfide isomerase/thioredoxin